jgi:hypothetical protein
MPKEKVRSPPRPPANRPGSPVKIHRTGRSSIHLLERGGLPHPPPAKSETKRQEEKNEAGKGEPAAHGLLGAIHGGFSKIFSEHEREVRHCLVPEIRKNALQIANINMELQEMDVSTSGLLFITNAMV